MGKSVIDLVRRYTGAPADELGRRIDSGRSRSWFRRYLASAYQGMPETEILLKAADVIGVPPFALAAAYVADRGIDSPFHSPGGVRFLAELQHRPADQQGKFLDFIAAGMEIGVFPQGVFDGTSGPARA